MSQSVVQANSADVKTGNDMIQTVQFVVKVNGVDERVHQLAIKKLLDDIEVPYRGVIKPNGMNYCKIVCSCEFEATFACTVLDEEIAKVKALMGGKI